MDPSQNVRAKMRNLFEVPPVLSLTAVAVPIVFRESSSRRQNARAGWYGFWRGGAKANSNGEQFTVAMTGLFLLGILTFLPGLGLAYVLRPLVELPWPFVRGLLFAPWVYLLYCCICRSLFSAGSSSRLSRRALSLPVELCVLAISIGSSFALQSFL